MIRYEYNAWSKLLSTTGDLASTVGTENLIYLSIRDIIMIGRQATTISIVVIIALKLIGL